MAAIGFTVEKAHTYEKLIDNHKVIFTMTISKDLNGQQLVISFGGPKTEDLIYIQSLYSSGFITIDKNKVEKGFWDIYTGAMKNDLTARLHNLNYSELIFVGHSVGGSMAVLAAYDVAASNSGLPKPHVYVYGALTVGDDNFVDHFKNLADVVRIKKNQDLYAQFPTCLITGIQSSVCFEDYSTLYSRYPFYRPYLSVAYPYLHGSGYWSSPFFNSYFGHYLPYGSHYGYGGYTSYPGQFIVGGRDDPQHNPEDDVPNQGQPADKAPQAEPIPLLNNKKGNATPSASQSTQNSKINTRTSTNPSASPAISPSASPRREEESDRIDLSSQASDQKGSLSNTRENQKHLQDTFGSTSSRVEENHDYNYGGDMHQSSARNTRNSRVESYSNAGASGYSNSSSASSFSNSSGASGYSNIGSSSGSSSSGNRISGSSYSSSFLEMSNKKRSSTKMRKVYRRAFVDYFNSLDNCQINGKSANCQVNPNVHKTYYGIDIENCY
jgi:hypothetical protein